MNDKQKRLDFFGWIELALDTLGGCLVWAVIIGIAVIYGTLIGYYLLGWLR